MDRNGTQVVSSQGSIPLFQSGLQRSIIPRMDENPETLKPEFLKGSLRPSPVRWGVRGNGEMPGGQEGQLMREEGSSAQALQIPGAGGMDREAARRCSQTEDVQRCSAPLQDKAPGKTHLYFQDMGRRPLLSI